MGPVGGQTAVILARCPACATVFRATADQLKLRDGLVRCGRCRTAFNALAHVVPASPLPAEAPSIVETALPEMLQQAPQADVVLDGSESVPDAGKESTSQSADPEEQEQVHDAGATELLVYETAAQPVEVEHLADSIAATMPASELMPSPWQAETIVIEGAATQSAVDSDAPLRDALALHDVVPAIEPAEADETRLPESADGAAEEDQQAQSLVERWSMHAWGAALAFVLALALLQLVYLYRSDIARASPPYRPMIESMCKTLGCKIELPQQAELISIEVSDLQPDPRHKERLVLAATLKNRAGFAQAFPYVELTLTDSRDQALARRVFPPDVYLSDLGKEETGFAANAEQTVRLLIDATGVGATGYRLYIFYP